MPSGTQERKLGLGSSYKQLLLREHADWRNLRGRLGCCCHGAQEHFSGLGAGQIPGAEQAVGGAEQEELTQANRWSSNAAEFDC